MSEVTRVLSIDGGGIRGIIPAIILDMLERQTGKRIHQLFDLVAGTSTGGIIACGLTKPKPLTARAMADIYIDFGADIFDCNPFRSVRSQISGSKYDEAALEQILGNFMGEAKLSQCLTDVLIPSYDIEDRRTHFFKSWRAVGEFNAPGETTDDADFLLRDVARATSAAPTYFEPARITNLAGREYHLIDGSIAANNPAMCALASVKKLYPDTKRIVLLSLGTGQPTRPIPYATAKAWGTLGWARPAFECVMDGMSDTVDYQVQESFGVDEMTYVRIETRMGNDASSPSDAIDDASPANIAKLIARANGMAREATPDLMRIWRLLVD